MSRGIVYHIVTDLDGYTAMDESDFYDSLGALGVDRVANQHAEDAKNSVERLVERLQKAGFAVAPINFEDEDFFSFTTGDEEETLARKSQYFAPAFAAFQKLASSTSLETFASDRNEEYELRRLIDNRMGDGVYYGNGLYEEFHSMDSFIRKLTPNTTYYIAPETVYMH